MAKKELTVKQDYKQNRIKQWVAFSISWVAIILPISIMFLVNYEKYFKNNPKKVNVATGAVLGLIVLVIAVINGAKSQSRVVKPDDPVKAVMVYIRLIFVWALSALMLTLLESILYDLIKIMWFELIGITVSAVAFCMTTEYKRKADKMKNKIEDEDIDYRLRKERKAKSEDIGSMLG